MSQHPSLRGADKGKQHRSVLKRYEKLKTLKEKEKWDETKDSVFGLIKVKVVKFKIKKEKAAAVEGEAAAPGAGAAAAPAAGTAKPAAGAAKSAAGAKAAPAQKAPAAGKGAEGKKEAK